ncbi:hypothetical protein G3497_06015 [Shewanella baltica]|nr:hypothetical protein [Shewanella baltica]
MFISHIAAHSYSYKKLGETASWDDSVTDHFSFKDSTHAHSFDNLKSWSKSFENFDNWINLNSVMTMTSNLETYIATIIKLALESDVGVLYGVPQKIDGSSILKHGNSQPFDFREKIISCTKGDWSSRISAYNSTFGFVPEILKTHISDLEKIRNLRNRVGHSFGRDIDKSRNHGQIDVIPIEKLRRDKALWYQSLIYGVAKDIDRHLHVKHVGEYQTVNFYHNLLKRLPDSDHYKKHSVRVATLKKELGRFGAYSAGKNFCSGLIEYYEKL